MTTIAYRNGVLAGDSRAYSGERMPIGTKTKVHRLSDGSLFGVSSGCIGADALVRAWVEDGCKPEQKDQVKPENFQLLLIRPNGDVFFARDNLSLSGPLVAPYVAIGTGAEYAMGAMEMGADSATALSVAIKLDPFSGGPITTLKLFGESE